MTAQDLIRMCDFLDKKSPKVELFYEYRRDDAVVICNLDDYDKMNDYLDNEVYSFRFREGFLEIYMN